MQHSAASGQEEPREPAGSKVQASRAHCTPRSAEAVAALDARFPWPRDAERRSTRRPNNKINSFYEEQFNPCLNFSPALRRAGTEDRPTRQDTTYLQVVCNSAGDAASLAGTGRILKEEITVEKPDRPEDAQSDTQAAIRDAEGKAKTVRRHPGKKKTA
jgi:hypothetical protein